VTVPPLLLVALAVLLASGGKGSGGKAAPPPRQLPSKGAMLPYLPTPPAVAKRAAELLPVLALGAEKLESDPTGTWPTVLYRAEWHPASIQVPRPHKGISVYRGGRRE